MYSAADFWVKTPPHYTDYARGGCRMCHWAVVMVIVDEENEVSCKLLNGKINIKLKYVI